MIWLNDAIKVRIKNTLIIEKRFMFLKVQCSPFSVSTDRLISHHIPWWSLLCTEYILACRDSDTLECLIKRSVASKLYTTLKYMCYFWSDWTMNNSISTQQFFSVAKSTVRTSSFCNVFEDVGNSLRGRVVSKESAIFKKSLYCTTT